MSLEELSIRLNEREYLNWLKAGRCLNILREGLHPFVSHHTRAFHQDLLNQNTQLRRPCETSSCRPRGNKLTSTCRPCSVWQTVIQRHQRQPNTTVHWDNCFPPNWRTDHWELAKAFMPRGQGKVKSADQCDASALLNLINHCDRFSFVDLKIVTEVIRHRNELMHSCELAVRDEWMRRYQAALRNLLQHLSNIPQMKRAEREINHMLTIDLQICVSGWDRLDSLEEDVAVLQSAGPQEPTLDLIHQWELELLQERLQELLHTDEDEDAQAQFTEQLKSLGVFLQANTDLSQRFSAELQAINSLEARE